jgi:hypothetical protein
MRGEPEFFGIDNLLKSLSDQAVCSRFAAGAILGVEGDPAQAHQRPAADERDAQRPLALRRSHRTSPNSHQGRDRYLRNGHMLAPTRQGARRGARLGLSTSSFTALR